MNRRLLQAVGAATGLDSTADLDFVLHTGSRGLDGCSLIFFFRHGRPVVVAKFGRTSDVSVERELRGLSAVAAIVPAESKLGPTLERLVGETRLRNGRRVILKGYLPGRPALQYIAGDPSRAGKILRDATQWQIDFLHVAKDWIITGRDDKERIAAGLWTDERTPTWWPTFVENDHHVCGPAHGDFLLTNILVQDGRLASVIDFENFSMEGVPIADFIGLLVGTGTAFLGQRDAAIDEIFLGRTWLPAAIRDEVHYYCEAFDLTVESLTSVLPLYSDRAITIARAWHMPEKVDFHRRLRSFFLANSDRVLLAWT